MVDKSPVTTPVPSSIQSEHTVEHGINDEPCSTEDNNDFIDLFPDLSDFRRRFASNFIFMYNNVNSYRHKHASICDILIKHLVDFIAIAETKLDASFPSDLFRVQNYEIYRQDLTSKSGGLLVHVRDDIPQRRLPQAEVNSNGFESICIELSIGTTKTVITSFYKHPNVKFDFFKTCFSQIIDYLLRTYDDLIFLADANCCPTKSNTIRDICDLYGLSNLIKDPTCHKGPNSTLLDIILVTNPKRYVGSLNEKFCLSDFHNIIGAATRRFAPIRKPYLLQYRSFKKFVDADFKQAISAAPLHVAEVFDDVNDMAWFTTKVISDIVEEHAPTKTKLLKFKPVPYMNSELRKTMYARNMARNKYRKFGKKYWENYRRLRNRVVALRNRSIKIYFQIRCEKPNREFWKTVSPFIVDNRSKSSNNITLNENEHIVTDSNEIAEIFNEHFVNVAAEIGFPDSITSVETSIEKHLNHSSILKIREKHANTYNSFSFHLVDSKTVMGYLKSFNPRKATGFDNIPGKLLRLAHQELSTPLTYLINASIAQNVFPDQMKCAEVSPIFKKNDKLNKKNFRPVSILTSISKIFEYIMNDQLLEHFHAIFHKLLSAYRKGYSFQSILLKFIEDTKKALDNRKYVGVIFMDLSKAFDCLPHGLLVATLNAYGLTLPACELLRNYLSGRRQRVKIGGTRSKWNSLEKGVPQGSILGPLLFNIFLNDLFYFIEKCSLYNFADDNSLSNAASTLSDLKHNLQHDSKICMDWFGINGMEANPSKFQFMVISSQPTEKIEISIDENVNITSEPVVKVLGVHIDCRLNFNEHIKQSSIKAARQLNALSRISKFLNVNSRKLIFRSFIMSNFTYCPLVWHFCGKTNNSKLEKIQERALRIVYNDYKSDYEELMTSFGTTTMLHSRHACILLEVFKSMKLKNPSYIQELFSNKETPYFLRDPSLLVQPKTNTVTFGLKTISYLGSKLWNDLENDFKHEIENLADIKPSEFRSLLKRWSGPKDLKTSTIYV